MSDAFGSSEGEEGTVNYKLSAENRRTMDRMPPDNQVEIEAARIRGQLLTLMNPNPGGAQVLDVDGFALEQAREKVALRVEAMRDSLTGAFGLAAIRNELAHNIRLAEMGKLVGVGFLYVDVDYLKSINDDEPDKHTAGDRAITAVARVMQEEALSNEAEVGRLHGEELVVVVPGASEVEIRDLATRIGNKVGAEAAGRASLVNHNKVTVSIGGAVHRPGESLDGFIARADQLVYQAKGKKLDEAGHEYEETNGRNRLVLEKVDGTKEIVKFGGV